MAFIETQKNKKESLELLLKKRIYKPDWEGLLNFLKQHIHKCNAL